MAKFDPSRVTGGTIELVRNPDGSYKSQVTGFNQIASLNLPEITTTAATTTSDATTTAAEKAQENLETQTSAAFKMPSVMQKDQTNQQDLSGEMTKEAAQTSKLLTETFKEPVEIKSPTAPLYDDFPKEQTTTNQVNRPDLGDTGSPVENILNEAKVKEDDTTITLSKARIRGPKDLGTTQRTTRTPQGFDPLGVMSPKEQRDQRFTDDAGLPEPALTDYPDLGPALGITTDRQPSSPRAAGVDRTLGITVPADRDLEADIGAQPREDIQSRPVKQSALKTLAETVKRNFQNIRVPSVVGTVLRTVAPPETPVQAHAKKYFNVRDDGRIAGNPNEDLYAGFNRTSAFGNLERAGEKRIETREKTIERKGYGPGDKFYDDTQRMKDQQDDYKSSKSKATASRAAPGSFRAAQEEGTGSSGTDSGKIVCTAMYKTTGLEEWKKHIRVWQIFERKYLTPYHEKGYHILFKPFVKGMHKSNIIKALGAHVAKHRTQDLKHIMFNSKPSWIGRIYRKILEPICYLVGRLWR